MARYEPPGPNDPIQLTPQSLLPLGLRTEMTPRSHGAALASVPNTPYVSRAREELGDQPLSTRLSEIRDDFALLDDWEDRYRYVIELGRQLPEFPEAMRTDANKVRGCASQVWIATRIDEKDGSRHLHFEGDSDAHIVRGLIAILFALYQDATPDEILSSDPQSVFTEFGLAEHLTQQRSNGLASMVARIRADASAAGA